MSNTEDTICRLCLRLLHDCDTIDANAKKMLNSIHIEIDFSVTDKPVMCKSCEKSLQQIFAFRSTQTQIEDHLLSFASNRSESGLDLKQFYLTENNNVDIMSLNDYDICRFCVQCVKKDYGVSLAVVKNGMALEKDLLPRCICENTELTSFIKEPVVCTTCIESLEKYLRFMSNCLRVEEAIKEYRKVKGTNSEGLVNLNSILEFISEKKRDILENEEIFKKVVELTEVDLPETPMEITQVDLEIKVEKNEETVTNVKEETVEIKVEQLGPNEKQSGSVDRPQDPDNTSKVAYICSFCPYETKDKESLALHKSVCKKRSIYKCESCTFKSKSKIQHKRHMLTHEDPSQLITFKCHVCAYATYRKQILRAHVLTHIDPSQRITYKCEVCPYKGVSKHKYKIHSLKHKDPSEVTMYRCDMCAFETYDKARLGRHMLQAHGDSLEIPTLRCDKCPYETQNKSCLRSHMLRHKNLSEVTVHECKVCTFKTKLKSSLKIHSATHKEPSELKMFQCELCDFKTRKKAYLREHDLTHKDRSELTMHQCDKCLYQTKWKQSLNQHMKIHKDPAERTVYQCEICSFKTKSNRSTLIRHNMMMHNDLSQVTTAVYKCDHCPYKAKRRWYLTKHMVIHQDPSSAPVFKCEECSLILKTKHNLNTHMLIHKDPSELTYYKCDLCPFKTKYKYRLRPHIMKYHKAGASLRK